MAETHVPHGAIGGPTNPSVSHEQTDAKIGAVLGFGVALLIVGVAIHFLVWLLFGYFEAREDVRVPAQYPLAASESRRLPPEPRLQTAPREDMRELRESEDAILAGYGWVDRNAGIVRIPIDEAMRLTLERGLPTREQKK